MTFHRLDGAHAGPGRGTIDPNCGEAQRLCWQHVVIKALADVQDAMSRDADAAQRKVENLQRWLVGSRLFRRDDLVELHPQLRFRSGEKIVVHVRNNGQSKAAAELAEGSYGVGPRLPFFERLRQRAEFLVGGCELEMLSELAHDRT